MVEQALELIQCLQRPPISDRLGAAADRLRHNSIRTFEADASAHPGNRVDEEAYSRHRRNGKQARG